MNVLCSAKACPVLLSTTCVFYEGENLIYTGINTNDNLQEALQKIDETIGNTFLAFVPLSRTITINGVTQNLSANRTWTVPSNNIYNSDGTLTGNRIVTVNDKQLVFRSNPTTTLQNYTFTIGTPTGVPPSTWPSSVIFEGEYLMSTANAEPYNTRVWGRNQSAGTRSLWVNQVFADITGESTGATNIYNQFFATRRGSLTDTSTTATSFMRGVWSEIGHRYGGASATLATINTSNQEAFFAQNLNITGNITNAIGFYAQSQTGLTGTPFTTNVTNYYGFFQYTIVVDTKSTITNHYGLFLSTPLIGTGGTIVNRWGIYAPDIATRHYFNGNVLLGTTTDTGLYKLDVNGAARVKGDVWFDSNDAGQSVLRVGSNTNVYFTVNSLGSVSAKGFQTNAGNTYINADGTMMVNSSLASPSAITVGEYTSGGNFLVFRGQYTVPFMVWSQAGLQFGNNASAVASALVELNSTTKGFLQPRMTTTERNAIASPATGLQVYNTTTNTNDYYNGTSWNTVSTGNIYTVDGTLTGNRTLTTAGNTLAFRTGGVDEFLFTPNNGSTFPIFKVYNVSFGGKLDLGYGYFQVGGGALSFGNTNSGNINIFAGTQKAQLFGGTGNLLIQTGGTFTDAGYKLDVQGTARVSGYALFGSGNSGTPLATLADFRGGSDVDFIQVARVSTSSDRYVRMYANGQINALSTKTDSAPYTFAAADNANTSGVRGLFTLTNTFNPTSGTATYTTFQINQTINQTGGANGITRGLYVNPTLTSAFDFRAIETTAGNVLFGSNFFWDNINGRLGIGTNTPAHRLQVKSSATNTDVISILNTSNVSLFRVFNGGSGQSLVDIGGTVLIRSDAALSYINSGNFAIGTTTDAGFKFDVNGTARIQGSLTMGLTQIIYWGSQLVLSRPGSSGVILSTGGGQLSIVNSANTSNLLTILNTGEATFLSSVQAGGGTTNASAVLQADSTTKGFLPPRMTNTQRTAIATPAVGLMVYCTDSVEGYYVYTSLGWKSLTMV